MVNRRFLPTLVALLLCAEIMLRLVPHGPPSLFRTVYGNSLSMHMQIAAQLAERASQVRVLGLGDSLAMTQFRPDLFADTFGYSPDEVFNAAYLGMSYPSQENLLRTVGLDRLERLELVLYFVNPRRLDVTEEPNTEVFRVGLPDPDGPWQEAWTSKEVSPILDHSRLYGLSRYLVFQAARNLGRKPSWDQIEYLQPQGGVIWRGNRGTNEPPSYPYPRLEHISDQRLSEMQRVIEMLRERGVAVTLVPSAMHSAVEPFASDRARRRFDETLESLADRTGSHYVRSIDFSSDTLADGHFCDYGHVNASGGASYTQLLGSLRKEILQEG